MSALQHKTMSFDTLHGVPVSHKKWVVEINLSLYLYISTNRLHLFSNIVIQQLYDFTRIWGSVALKKATNRCRFSTIGRESKPGVLIHQPQKREDDRCLHVVLPVRHSLKMSIKSVAKRATLATRAGCVRHGMGHNTSFSGCGNRNASEDDPRHNILQLNTEGLTANKISVIEQLSYKNNSFIIVL